MTAGIAKNDLSTLDPEESGVSFLGFFFRYAKLRTPLVGDFTFLTSCEAPEGAFWVSGIVEAAFLFFKCAKLIIGI